MTRSNPFLRAGLTLAVLVAVAALFGMMRMVRANGVFSGADTGFSGSCKTIAVAGVADMEIDAADHLAFLAVLNARQPGPADGLYALDLAGAAKLTRLPGAPADFHPRGIGLLRTANGGLYLAAVNHRSSGLFSIDIFEVPRKDGVPSLSAINTIQGGLLTDPQDVAMAGPDSFYVSNGVTAKNALLRWLQGYGVLAGGNIVYFNGMSLREVVGGISGARGLALTGDGGHLLAAGVTGRDLVSLSREPFTGNLTEAGQLDLPAGPDRLALDGNTLWVGAHANLFSWRAAGRDAGARAPSQVFRVTLPGGVPQSADQVYGNDGNQIGGAAVGAASGRRLLIGSPLDGKLLDCAMN